MLEKVFGVTEMIESIQIGQTLAYMLASVILGAIIAAVYVLITDRQKRSFSFIVSLLMLPAVVTVVIILVGSNVARAFSIAGIFSLVRFRSAAGEGKDISLVFMAMAAGLSCGLGYITLAFAVVLVMAVIIVIGYKFVAICFRNQTKQLRVLVPEDMNYTGAFDDLFNEYTRTNVLEKVKTTNMGTLFELTFRVLMKKDANEKKFIDELRSRNGNLTITLSIKDDNGDKL